MSITSTSKNTVRLGNIAAEQIVIYFHCLSAGAVSDDFYGTSDVPQGKVGITPYHRITKIYSIRVSHSKYLSALKPE